MEHNLRHAIESELVGDLESVPNTRYSFGLFRIAFVMKYVCFRFEFDWF